MAECWWLRVRSLMLFLVVLVTFGFSGGANSAAISSTGSGGEEQVKERIRRQLQPRRSSSPSLLIPRQQVAHNSTAAMGPTPSTSVALIILYSVTGVITALFLLIIVTGAIRAHRHPERYGPRATGRFGRPRQSRAKGLARAVLDTIPIVRFGTSAPNEIDKTPDVEMRDHDDASVTNEPAPEQAGNESAATSENDTTTTATVSSTERTGTVEERREGGNQQDTTTADGTTDSAAITGLEGQNQCPVCMDDFEQGQDVRVLPCKHNFHPDCIDPWLLNVSGSCPLCRIDLHPEHEQAEDDTASDVPQPPPPAAQRDQHSHHQHHSRLSRYLDIARGTTSGDERMAALRQLREENRARSRGHRMSQRLSRALSRRPPQQQENTNTNAAE